MENSQLANQTIKRTKAHESPRNHYISYAVSLLLTALAFLAVANPSMGRTFTYIFISILAIIQALFQFVFWMHMKEKGHIFPAIGIAFGVVIALCAFVTAVFWVWW